MTDIEKQLRWDRHFLELALAHAKMSKDPSTKVGAVIVGPDLEIRAIGFNGFPRGIVDDQRLGDREVKYQLIVHAEVNAIAAAARVGTPLKGCSLYVSAINREGSRWGGPPCVRCTVTIIQAGIGEIIALQQTSVPERWQADLALSRTLLMEAQIKYREVGHY